MGSGSMYDNTPTSRFEEDMRAIIDGTPWPDRPPKSKMEILLKELYDSIGDWKSKTKGAYVLHGSATLQTLPSDLTVDMVGWTYDMSEEFTTDSRFVEVGKKYPAGTNVSIANVGTDEIPVLKYDVMAAFVDVDAIYNAINKVADMVADEFDSASAYSIGDIVWYEDTLYTFTSAHTAGSAWSSLEVTQTTVEEVLTAAVSSINNALSDIEGMIGTEFNAANPYSKGDYVIYQDDLYKFTANHTAGAAWNSSIVTAIDLTSAIKAIEAALSAKQDALPLSFSGNDITTNGNLTASGHVKDGLGNDMESLSALEQSASGNPIVVNAQDVAAKGLKVRIEPIQSGTGDPSPTNVRPISGRTEVNLGRTGKNLLPMTVDGIKAANTSGTWNGNDYTISGVTFAVQTDSDGNVTGVKTTGTASATCRLSLITDFSAVDFSGMIINGCNANGSDSKYFMTVQQANSPWATYATDYGSGATIASITGAIQIFIGIVSGQNTNGLAFYPMIRDAAESDPTFVPYKGSVTLTIALGQTVYDGTLDVKTGVLTVTHVIVDLASLNWTADTLTRWVSDIVSDMLSLASAELMDGIAEEYSVYTLNQINSQTSLIGLASYGRRFQVRNGSTEDTPTGKAVYPLATPTTIQLTPAQLELLKGYNYITGDGIIDLVYVPESISGLMEEVLVPISMLGTNESGNTKASRAYTSGEYFYKDQKMYKATTSIASGATFTVGTNCTQTTLFAELKAAQN